MKHGRMHPSWFIKPGRYRKETLVGWLVTVTVPSRRKMHAAGFLISSVSTGPLSNRSHTEIPSGNTEPLICVRRKEWTTSSTVLIGLVGGGACTLRRMAIQSLRVGNGTELLVYVVATSGFKWGAGGAGTCNLIRSHWNLFAVVM